MKLFGNTFETLEHSLRYATARNNTISSNIANMDTPNYKSKDVIFKNVLNNALTQSISAKQTHPKHLPFNNNAAKIQTITNGSSMYNHNGNNVDVDKEMAELAKNQIYYQGLVDRLNGKFGSIQTVIRGGN